MANQAIGLTHILPNAETGTVATGALSGLSIGDVDVIVIPISDLTAVSAQATDLTTTGFNVVYKDSGGSDTTYYANGDLFVQLLVGKWNTRYQQIKTDYDADQAKASASQKATTQQPSAVSSNGLGNLSSVGGTDGKLKNSLTLNFQYSEPTITLVDEDD